MYRNTFLRPKTSCFVAMIGWMAMFLACTGSGPGPLRTQTIDDVAVETHSPPVPKDSSALQVATAVPVQPLLVAAVSADPPLATTSAHPLDVRSDKPYSLIEDTCTSCGGAVWRTLVRDVNPYPRVHGDRLLLQGKYSGASLQLLLLDAKNGAPLWMRTIKSPDSSTSLSSDGPLFLADGTIAAIIERNRGGRAHKTLLLLGIDGTALAQFDFDPSLSRVIVQPLDSGFLAYGSRYALESDPVERTYLALHDAKGRPIGALLDEKDAQVECIMVRPQKVLHCSIVFQSKKMVRLTEIDAKTMQVISKRERPVHWLRPFLDNGLLYHGVLEKPGNNEWSIFRVMPDGNEHFVARSNLSLSTEMGNVPFLVEYGGRERRYFPLFSKSKEPAHILVGPEKAYVTLGPKGDAFSSYEGVFARWAAASGPKGSTIAEMKLLSR